MNETHDTKMNGFRYRIHTKVRKRKKKSTNSLRQTNAFCKAVNALTGQLSFPPLVRGTKRPQDIQDLSLHAR